MWLIMTTINTHLSIVLILQWRTRVTRHRQYYSWKQVSGCREQPWLQALQRKRLERMYYRAVCLLGDQVTFIIHLI